VFEVRKAGRMRSRAPVACAVFEEYVYDERVVLNPGVPVYAMRQTLKTYSRRGALSYCVENTPRTWTVRSHNSVCGDCEGGLPLSSSNLRRDSDI